MLFVHIWNFFGANISIVRTTQKKYKILIYFQKFEFFLF
jgi:hypothetical protein